MTGTTSIEIHPLTPSRRAEFMHLFDGKGFADNPDWSGCYCRFYHFEEGEGAWENETAAVNRAAACDLIASGTMRGWLALKDGEAVGWVNAGPKQSYQTLRAAEVPGRHDDVTAMIVCFLVAPDCRGDGIAAQLLDAAIEGLRASEIRYVEAKPAKSSTAQSGNYHGPLTMYEKADFEIVGDFSEWQYLVRREI